MSPVFAGNPWFSSLCEADARDLLDGANERVLRPGEMLFRQGDEVPGGSGFFYGLARGLLKFSSLSAAGREAILLIMEAGNWFGELSLIDKLPRTHDATAVSDAAVLEVSAARFTQLMQKASFAGSMSRLLVARTRALYGSIEHATLSSNRAKLAHRLLLLAQGGATLSPELRSTLSVSHESLSMMLGVSRPTLQKDLKQLATAGIVELHYGRIRIVDAGALAAELRR
jgi:CRP/FNR family cyclic AMP-dependent transcriptional regulator